MVGASAILSGLVGSQPVGFITSDYVSGLGAPTAIAFQSPGRLWVAEKGGAIKVFNGGVLQGVAATIACSTDSERGVLGLAFDPNFTTNHFVYVYYTTNGASLNAPPTPKNRVSRFLEMGGSLVGGSETILLDQIPSDAGNHNAGCLRFGIDGKLYIATGDGGSDSSNSQNFGTLAGKILRINPDGTVPSDNPFVGQPPKRPEIFMYGLRNPFRFAFRPGTNVIYVADVGQNTWEEVNVGLPGGNYGWPTHEGVAGAPGFVDPVHAYNHDGQGASITGGCFVGNRWPVDFQSRYLFGDYVLGELRWLQVDGANQFVSNGPFMSLSGPVDFTLGSDGALYVLSINLEKVVRVSYRPVPSSLDAPATVYGGNPAACAVNLDVPAPASGQTVTLTSSDPTVLSCPSSITVAAGTSSRTFTAQTVGQAAHKIVTLTATCNGVSTTKNITVVKTDIGSLSLTPWVVVGGDDGSGTIALNGKAPAGGLNLSLFSGNPALAQVAPNLPIAAGASGATFVINTSPVTFQQTVSVSATLGSQTVQKTLTVQSALYLVMSVSVTPGSIVSGTGGTGRVTINRPAPSGGKAVTIVDNAGAVGTPATVTVPQGATATTFPITTSAVDSTFTINVRASIDASYRLTTFSLLPCPIKSIAIYPANCPGGIDANGKVTLRQAAPAGGALVALADYSNFVSVPASTTIPSGQTTSTFPVATTPVATNVIVTVTATYQGAVRKTVMTVTNPVVPKSVAVSPGSIVGGQSATGTITLNKPVGSGTFSVSISDNLSATTMPASLTFLAGQASRNFGISSVPVGASYVATITVNGNGVTRTTTLTVHP